MQESPQRKIRILFRGWFSIPHSYAIVNCFQLLALYKKYKDRIEFYIDEQPYYNPKWNGSKKLVYSESDNEIIKNLPKWHGQEIDLVYSITYPYDIQPFTVNGDSRVPKCIFYTSEFAWLNQQYFRGTSELRNVEELQKELLSNQEFYYTAPSIWSYHGLRSFGVQDVKNRIITHGVETSIFKQLDDLSIRNKIRSYYGVTEDEVLLINIGSMTENKGIVLILESLHKLVHQHGLVNYKLLLKGSGDLYESQTFVENYFSTMCEKDIMNREHVNNLLDKHIIFTNKTLSYEKINELYNAADFYVSPYLAEGFNLTVLEALSAGLPVIVPKTGSTKEFMEDIYTNGNGRSYIHYVESRIGRNQFGMHQNIINTDDIVATLKNLNANYAVQQSRYSEYDPLRKFVCENYSWSRVADLLYDYFTYILDNCRI